MKKYGAPRSIVTDRLRASSAAMNEIGVAAERHEVGVGSTIELRIRINRFGDANGRCNAFEVWMHNQFNQERHFVTKQVCKLRRSAALAEWRSLAA
jgi:putative transposase